MEHQTPPKTGSVIPKFEAKDIEENKAMAAISYIGILCLIPLILKKDSRFAQEHAKQGFVLFVAELAVWILGMLPVIGWFLIGPVGCIVAIVISIIALLKTLQGEFWEIPLLGQYRNKVNF